MDPIEYSAKVLKQEKRFLRYLKRVERSLEPQRDLSGFMENQRKTLYLVFPQITKPSLEENRGKRIAYIQEPAGEPIYWPSLRVAGPLLYRFYTNRLFHNHWPELTVSPEKI